MLSSLLLLVLACDPLSEPGVQSPGLDAAVGAVAPKDTGEPRETGNPPDTGTSSTETDETGESGGGTDTGTSSTETAETGAGTDTGTSSTETGETGAGNDTGTSATETGETGAGTDTGTSATETAETGGGTDTGTSSTGETGETGAGNDTGTSSTETGDTGGGTDTGTSSTETAVGVETADTADTADTGKPADTGNVIVPIDTSVAFRDTDTSVYTPAACDSGDTGGGCDGKIRFVALGDAGTGDARQTAVAKAIEDVCALEGCDFALYLGDNIYGSGPTDVADVQWDTKFEIPYAGLGFQFYAVLGNHDYGGFYDTATAAVEVAYTAYSTKWYMPTRYYSEVIGDLTVIGLDSQALQLGYGADQDAWIGGALASVSTTWSIVTGHHPYISNGPHGDAGEYDGRAGDGVAFKDFFDSYLCGNVDVYLSGHDHALQWMQTPTSCDTVFIVAGGGGNSSYPLVGTNAVDFEDSTNGFLWVELDGRQFTGVFYDESGTELYRATFTK